MSRLAVSTWSIRPAAAAALGALMFGVAACGGADGVANAANGDAATDVENSETQAAVDPLALAQDGDVVLGDPTAPVTVIEYASVTCPACANFHSSVLPGIKEKFIDTGKVQFVFREFPTPPMQFSLIGSVMARCAAEKAGDDAFFLVLGALFQNQRAWIGGEDPKQELLKIAGQAGMDEAAFDACLQRQDLVDTIQEGVTAAAETFSVSSTPSFIIGGEKVMLRNVEEFEKRLDAAHAAATATESTAETAGD